MYDLIGDIRGYAAELHALLACLSMVETVRIVKSLPALQEQ
jgi:hypothetical protein